MASAIDNSDNAAMGTAEASSYKYLKEFDEQISTDSSRIKSHILMQIVPAGSEKNRPNVRHIGNEFERKHGVEASDQSNSSEQLIQKKKQQKKRELVIFLGA